MGSKIYFNPVLCRTQINVQPTLDTLKDQNYSVALFVLIGKKEPQSIENSNKKVNQCVVALPAHFCSNKKV